MESRRVPAAVGAVWVALVAGALVVGRRHGDAGVLLGAAPFVGRWRSPDVVSLLPAATVGALVAIAGPALADRLRWSRLLIVSGASAVAWATALAASDGWARLTTPLATRYEYEPFAATVGSARSFLEHFTERLPTYPTHARGHPPGAVLVPWALDRLGLGGAGWFAAVVIAAWGVATVAVLVAVRTQADERLARRAAPAIVVLPAAVWAATSADALFAGVAAVGVALALVRRRGTSVAGGVVLGGGLLLSYGVAVVVAVVVGTLAVARRWADAGTVVAAAAAVLVAAWLWSGFWWPAGAAATRVEYWNGVASRRPTTYLVALGNPAALAVALGPAAVVGVVDAVRRRRPVVVLVMVAAVVATNLSLMTKGEVERIWLPFAVVLAGAAWGHRRLWLAAQVAVGLAVQGLLRSPW